MAPPLVAPPLVAPSLVHVWLADCNVGGAGPAALVGALPALQTLVVRHVSKHEDLPACLLQSLRGLKVRRGCGGACKDWYREV